MKSLSTAFITTCGTVLNLELGIGCRPRQAKTRRYCIGICSIARSSFACRRGPFRPTERRLRPLPRRRSL